MVRRLVRKLRHWKQRYDKNAEFVWARVLVWQGEQVVPGEPIPEDLNSNKTKLRRFWESRVIQLAEFEDPDVATGEVPEIPEPQVGEVVKDGNRKWRIEGHEGTFSTKKAATVALVELNAAKVRTIIDNEAVRLEAEVAEKAAAAENDAALVVTDEVETTESELAAESIDDDSWLEGNQNKEIPV